MLLVRLLELYVAASIVMAFAPLMAELSEETGLAELLLEILTSFL